MKHKVSKTTLLIALAVLSITTTQIQAATIIDGNFESPALPSNSTQAFTTGQTFGGVWRVDAAVTSVVLVNGTGGLFPATPDANQFIYLGSSLSPATLAQDISGSLSAGEVFTIQFLQSTTTPPSVPGRVNLQVVPTAGGAAIYNNDFLLPSLADWNQRSATVSVPTAGNYTMRFSSFSGTAGAIDRVAIVVPEPTTICFLLIGATLLSTRKRA